MLSSHSLLRLLSAFLVICAAHAYIQAGNTFPEGVNVKAETGVPCGTEDIGRLSFNESINGLLLCTGDGFIDVANPNASISAQMQTVHALLRPTALRNLVFCSGHGSYRLQDLSCTCSNDVVSGFSNGAFCEQCQEGWERPVGADETGDCTEDVVAPQVSDISPATLTLLAELHGNPDRGQSSVIISASDNHPDFSVEPTFIGWPAGNVVNDSLGFLVTIVLVDPAGNEALVDYRVRVVDVDEPVVHLIGESAVSIAQYDVWSEPGAFAVDNALYAELSAYNGSEGYYSLASYPTFDTSVVGTHNLTYTFTDGSGNTGSTTRTVTVTPVDECQLSLHNCHSEVGICTNTLESFTCACATAYGGNGVNCTFAADWTFSEWSECSVLCGGGVHNRTVYCHNSVTLETLPDNVCTPGETPHNSETCNSHECVGLTSSLPGLSCLDIRVRTGVETDGPYWVKPDGFAGAAFQAQCDMNIDGGGWTLAASFIRNDAENWNTEGEWTTTAQIGSVSTYLTTDFRGYHWNAGATDFLYKAGASQSLYGVLNDCSSGESLRGIYSSTSWIADSAAKVCLVNGPENRPSSCLGQLAFRAYDATSGGVHGQAMLTCQVPVSGGDGGDLGQVWHNQGSGGCHQRDFGCWNNGGFTALSPVTLWIRE